MQFVKCDGGRSLSTIYPTLKGRRIQKNGMRFKLVQDCAVRAISTACEVDYDYAFEILEAEDSGSVLDVDEKIEGKTINGWNIKLINSRASKLTRIEFPKLFPVGRFVCSERGWKHMVAYIDGVRYDDGLTPDLWRMAKIWKLTAEHRQNTT